MEQVPDLLCLGVCGPPGRSLGKSGLGEKGLAPGRLGIFCSRWIAEELSENEPSPGK